MHNISERERSVKEGGRPRLPQALVRKALKLHRTGLSHGQVATRLGISRGSAAGIVRRYCGKRS
jgi:orotate phosphoribosyltransferase-like protein